MRRVIFYLITLFAVLSCVRETEKGTQGMDSSLEGKPVMVTFSLPDIQIAPSTKSLDTGDGFITGTEYLDPDKLYLVVCGHNQSIKYIRKAEPVIDESTNKPLVKDVDISKITDYPIDKQGKTTVKVYYFKVELELSDSDRTIHVLGNIDENQLTTGSYSYQVLPKLLSYEGKQAYWQKIYLANIHALLDENKQPVMSGGVYLPDEYVEERLSYIPLIRNYAKIQVTNATAPEDEFELFSYAVIYFPTHGSVVPFRYNVDNIEQKFSFNVPADSRLSGYESCNFKTLDETLEYQGHIPSGVEFNYDIPDAALFEHPENSDGRVVLYNKDDPDQGIYLYERGVPTTTMDPSFVIIRGRFGNNDYFYYRLDLMETKKVNNESVYEYYPIYRNFRYNIQVNRISSQGVSTPKAAAKSSGAVDISADISMRHLSDISNGQTRLVVEPYMARTYTGPSADGYYYLYARFYNDVNSAVPNTDWGAVTVELEKMEDGSDDILILYDDDEHAINGGGFFYPVSQEMGGEEGFRIIRFNAKEAGSETKTQKIKITGRDQSTSVVEEFPLYREVEISVQKRQLMTVNCKVKELSLQMGSAQEVSVTIPSGLPESMFPLDFIIEAEDMTLTPDGDVAGNNLPVTSGISISDNEGYQGRYTFQFIRTLTLDEYNSLQGDGSCTFTSYFKSTKSRSATTVWVDNEFFFKDSDSFTNAEEPTNHFYVKAGVDEDCIVRINIGNNKLQYKMDDGAWQPYTSNTPITLERTHKVSFKSTVTILAWDGITKFYCYKPESANKKDAQDGKFSVGGNIASLIVGDSYEAEGQYGISGNFSFRDFFKNHPNLTDASELILPMMTCKPNCYKSMFEGCTSLKYPPELPATTLASTCYRNMFFNCSSLVDAPYLPAETITNDCYQRMFYGCTLLRLIKMNSKEYKSGAFISDNASWVYLIPAGGEIWLNPAIKKASGYQSVIPAGWTVKALPDGADW